MTIFGIIEMSYLPNPLRYIIQIFRIFYTLLTTVKWYMQEAGSRNCKGSKICIFRRMPIPQYITYILQYCIGIKLGIYVQQKWKVQMQETMYNYNDKKIYFSLYANCSLITYQPNRANLIWKKKSEFKGYYKSIVKGTPKQLEKNAKLEAKSDRNFIICILMRLKLAKAVCLELPDYCE